MACPWIVDVRHREVAASLLLLVAAAAATPTAVSLAVLAALATAVAAVAMGALARRPEDSWPALAMAAALTMVARGTRSCGEGGGRGGRRWVGGPSGLAGSKVVDVDLLEQQKQKQKRNLS
jgi:hypothetical protein